MIIVNKRGTLKYKRKIYRCSIGKNGLSNNKIEGDNCSPTGIFTLGKLYVRTDRIKNIETKFKYVPIKKNMAWSDDPDSPNYNKLFFTSKSHKEKLFRTDNIYDLVLVINYNIFPTIAYNGSAIFIHIAKRNFDPTNGCIAIKKSDFKEILITLKPSDKIKIHHDC